MVSVGNLRCYSHTNTVRHVPGVATAPVRHWVLHIALTFRPEQITYFNSATCLKTALDVLETSLCNVDSEIFYFDIIIQYFPIIHTFFTFDYVKS